MRRVTVTIAAASLVLMSGIAATAIAEKPVVQNAAGWTLPADADDKKNPLPVDEQLLATGKPCSRTSASAAMVPAGSATARMRIRMRKTWTSRTPSERTGTRTA